MDFLQICLVKALSTANIVNFLFFYALCVEGFSELFPIGKTAFLTGKTALLTECNVVLEQCRGVCTDGIRDFEVMLHMSGSCHV